MAIRPEASFLSDRTISRWAIAGDLYDGLTIARPSEVSLSRRLRPHASGRQGDELGFIKLVPVSKVHGAGEDNDNPVVRMAMGLNSKTSRESRTQCVNSRFGRIARDPRHVDTT